MENMLSLWISEFQKISHRLGFNEVIISKDNRGDFLFTAISPKSFAVCVEIEKRQLGLCRNPKFILMRLVRGKIKEYYEGISFLGTLKIR